MGEKNNGENGGGGRSNVTVVLKADLHCDGCVSKVLKCIRSLDGVYSASIGGEQKITVVGKVDPMKLRNKVEQKTHKKFELISPQPKKENSNNDDKENAKGKENNNVVNPKQEKKKNNKEQSNDKNSKNKSDKDSSEKEKKIPVTTTVLRMRLHCEGCIQKIRKSIAKTKGYSGMKIDKEKNLVTVTGAMDVEALAQVLRKHVKKEVEILPQKDAAAEKEKSGGEKQKNGNKKEKNNAGGGKEKAGGGGKEKADGGGGDGGDKTEAVNKAQSQRSVSPNPNPNPYPGEQYFYYYPAPYNWYVPQPYHAPQLFSDENPNACSVM
ncbi:heavy metal-associated isoprenylated plant protein 3-like [Andrographis paniculata]|uniref:heavy metal-associated isoprenylated plant protein 3-like n=1 Tax=Andrographis paniculata TaxID=175694 RepID=UPI0021E6F290|nr:heavy metal-associated isoprenylated plant protein 3-like [Andrographis paniculata]